VRAHYPGRSLLVCVTCALTAANVAMSAGWPVTLEPAQVGPQPPCQGCGAPIERCGPALWLQGRKCCPDCTHGQDAPGVEYEPERGSPRFCAGCQAPPGAIGPVHTCGRQT